MSNGHVAVGGKKAHFNFILYGRIKHVFFLLYKKVSASAVILTVAFSPFQQGSSPLFSALADGLNFVQKVGYLFFQVLIETFTFLCLFHQVLICFVRSHHRLYRAVPSVDQAMWVTTITFLWIFIPNDK